MSKSLLSASNFGKEIRKRLIDLDTDVGDLARSMGHSASYINEVLRGTRNSESMKRKICEAVGLDFDDLMQKLEVGA